jgi:hypothetical protein
MNKPACTTADFVQQSVHGLKAVAKTHDKLLARLREKFGDTVVIDYRDHDTISILSSAEDKKLVRAVLDEILKSQKKVDDGS